jgi:predicted dehydrogenase
MYRQAIAGTYAAKHELVALCDINPGRLALSAESVEETRGNGIPTYPAAEFKQMLREQRPDAVVVTTPDFTHDQYIVEALRGGSDVLTEKPMTTDLSKLKAILDAQRETGKRVTVTFNYRYTPARTQLKELLMSGAIGEVTAVEFSWHLDRVHGADYFRRWHRYKNKSGGLLVHKATHHFDLVNWWLGSRPAKVTATGKRVFYTPRTAAELGLDGHGPRCHGCPVFDKCPYHLDLEADENLRELYLDQEEFDGYWRDMCVWAEDITIEDTMQVQVEYANRVSMNYTLVAYSPWEGFEITFHGRKGELTHRHVEVHGVFGGTREHARAKGFTTTLHLHGAGAEDIPPATGSGAHGGADPVMLGYLFDPEGMEPDRYGRSSDQIAGAWSILTGISANASIATGQTVVVDDLLREHGIVIG